MKFLTKLSLSTIFAAVYGSSAGLADDQQAKNLRDTQRADDAKNQRTTTIAVYGTRGIGRSSSMMDDRRSDVRWEYRWNAKGERFMVAVPAR